MKLRSVMVQLREEQIAQLDADAARTGSSRSKLVRDAVDAALQPVVDANVAELYRRAYPEGRFGRDEFGDRDAWHASAAHDRTNTPRDTW